MAIARFISEVATRSFYIVTFALTLFTINNKNILTEKVIIMTQVIVQHATLCCSLLNRIP